MFCRERRSWTLKEDQLLREAVGKEDPNNSNPSKWHAIAKHVPNRTNKDCRKRWFAKMASDVVKGGWSPEEDERLIRGIDRYGTRWSLVASVVHSRNSDQCAKRWTDTLNPSIDRTTWTAESDEILLQAVEEHGKVWTKIVKTYFPGRTGLSAKNRYNSITRFNNDNGRGTRLRRKSVDTGFYSNRRVGSRSSSSSASPTTPSSNLPSGMCPSAPYIMTASQLPSYDIADWASPSMMGHSLASNHGYGRATRGVSSSSASSVASDTSYQNTDFLLPTLTPTEMGQSLALYGNGTLLQGSEYYKNTSTSLARMAPSANYLLSPIAPSSMPQYSHYAGLYAGNESSGSNYFSSPTDAHGHNHLEGLINAHHWDASVSNGMGHHHHGAKSRTYQNQAMSFIF